MDDETDLLSSLARQPNPDSKVIIPEAAPSLLLYLVLLLFSIAMLIFSLIIENTHQSGFLLNLSTEIIGAIIILIIVDRRVRPKEVEFFQHLPIDFLRLVRGAVSPEYKTVLGYSMSFANQLNLVSLGNYLSRPALEKELLAHTISVV